MNVPAALVGAAIETLFPEVVVTTWLAPPLILDAPVNVTRGGVAFWHTVVVPEIIAVGKDITVIVALPVTWV